MKAHLLKAFALLLAVLLVGCGQAEESQKETVKIGVTAPLSGSLAFIGEGTQNGALLAMEDLGETKYNYELVIEDDGLDPKRTASVMQKFASVDNVDAVISISSGTGNVVSPMAEQSQIIHIGIASDADVAEGMYNFIHWTPPQEETKVWLQEARSRGYKRIAVITTQHEGTLAIAEQLEKDATGGIAVVDVQEFAAKTTDFKTIILKSQQAKPDIYLVIAFSPELEVLYKQMKESGISVPISAIEAYELSSSPELFEGEWYVNAADATGDFVQKYDAAYGATPGFGSANAYDAVKLIVQAYEQAGTSPAEKPSRAAVAATLQGTTGYTGALGTLSVGPEGIINSKAVVRTIKDGTPVTIK